MPNFNELHPAVKGRNPLCVDDRPAFAQPEVTEAAVWIENCKYDADRSTDPASAAQVSVRGLDGWQLVSDEPRRSGLVVHGGAESFQLRNANIQLSGEGCSDFTSKGAAAMAFGGHLTIENSVLETSGSGRPATIATKGGILHVKNSRLATHGGPLPKDYVPVIGPGMMEPPAPLGLSGNCRTHLSMDQSESYFDNCDISCAAWAALSTDASGGYLYLEANDSRITCEGNGYATYADNGCHVRFNRCQVKSGNMAIIQDGNSSCTFVDTDCVCGKYGMLLHGGMPKYQDLGLIEVHGGSLVTEDVSILAKSTNVDVYLSGVQLVSHCGTLVKTMESDDEFYHKTRSYGPDCYGVQITFEDMTMTGDLLNEDPERKVIFTLTGSTLTGRVTGNPTLRLLNGSTWVPTGDSEVTLADGDLTAIQPQNGAKVTVHLADGTVKVL
jgi:hypothetical protein